MGSFNFGSRILKETASLVRSKVVRQVDIVALHEDGLNEREEIDDSRSVWRVRLRSRGWSRNLFVQLIKYVEFSARVIWFARRKGVGLVNIHHLAILPLGVVLKWTCGAKLVYDAHELETETFGLSGLRQGIARHVERISIKYADLVIVVSDGICDWYHNKYGLSNIVTVQNCPEFQVLPRVPLLHRELGIPEGSKIVIYQGELIRGRGIEGLLISFAEFKDDQYVLVLMGYGELEPLIKDYAHSHGNIYFRQAVAPSAVLRYTASADVGIAYIHNSSLNDHYCLPNKLFEYIMASLPVLVNDVPEMRRVVTENKIGIVLNELTPQSLRNALDELECMENGGLNENLKQAAIKYSWEEQERVMINAYGKYV
jgi:glycosyltransferase involved in cell wall biosynthesis